jgi:ribosome-binding factor A
MSTRRTKQMGGLIQETLAQLLLRSVSDPRLQNVVVTDVVMSADLKVAKIYFTKTQVEQSWNEKEVLQGFKKAGPYLKRMLGQELELRSVPELRFLKDTHGEGVNRLFHLMENESTSKLRGEE